MTDKTKSATSEKGRLNVRKTWIDRIFIRFRAKLKDEKKTKRKKRDI